MDKEKCNDLIEYTKKEVSFTAIVVVVNVQLKIILLEITRRHIEEVKEGIVLVLGASEERIKNYIEYFEGQGIEFVGDNIHII